MFYDLDDPQPFVEDIYDILDDDGGEAPPPLQPPAEPAPADVAMEEEEEEGGVEGLQEFGAAGGSEVLSAGAGYQVGDVLTGTLPLAGTQTFVVKAASGRYYFDGKQAGDFALFKGKTYILNASDAGMDTHPIFFGTVVDDTASIIGSSDGVTYTLDGTDVSEADW